MGLSYLPQEASVFRKLNVEDNIRAVLELQKKDGKPLSKNEIELKLDGLLAELQIEKLRTYSALSLSGGERRRVEIARALASDPHFILLDEPFAGIDPIAVIEIQRIVRFLKERGHRRPDHRSQCPGDTGYLRPRIHYQSGYRSGQRPS